MTSRRAAVFPSRHGTSRKSKGGNINADAIFTNARIFTADKDRPEACALAVKDGRFCYVGDEAGLTAYEGEVRDLGGRFIMPGIIDSHVHIGFAAAFEYAELGEPLACENRQGISSFIAEHIRKNPAKGATGS